MVPSLGADSVGLMMLRLQAETRLRAASDAVLAFLRSHPLAGLWGGGLFASADMMSLEATRYLWAARLDPRRRTYAVGTYTHVLDQWGILYDQPIVLNRRQAGAAIEGALRQQHVPDLERVAVDTHGFTHFAMTLAKLVGFDLCPRLARLKTRRLYLTRGIKVPTVLQPIVAETVSRRAITRAWDGLLRLASSVRDGWCPATEALERFGSAARGDPIHTAGEALGKLLRTVYLCDYLGNPSFRREILDLLNQGEAVHSLQRAIQQGPIGAKRGRTIEQLATISGALTLLANVIMAWNTHRMQAIRRPLACRLPRRADRPHRADHASAHQHARDPHLQPRPPSTQAARPHPAPPGTRPRGLKKLQSEEHQRLGLRHREKHQQTQQVRYRHILHHRYENPTLRIGR